MPINTELLFASEVLQQYLVDKDTGFPLANGQVSLFQDTNRTIYKNWYYQTGVPGDYTYIPLDNPLYLSSVGTIQDPNGNDVIPYYYPWTESEPVSLQKYYVTVYSTDENSAPTVLQFTRENWPPLNGEGGGLEVKGETLRNYIINNVFWRNCESLDCTDVLNGIIAPSQHDGYDMSPTAGMSDIRFMKSKTGANDAVTFSLMDGDVLGESPNSNIAPEYYMNTSCSIATIDETYKYIQYPLSLHLATLVNVEVTLVAWARNVGSNPNSTIKFYAYAYQGANSPAIDYNTAILFGEMTLNNSGEFQRGVFTKTLTSTATTSVTGDDAWMIVLALPLNATYDIDHTKLQLYMGDAIANNDFDTYDQIGAIIDSPRTGDFRQSLNSFSQLGQFGWVAANDGTIGNAGSSATCYANNRSWPLYKMLWDNVLDNWAPVSTGRGASAYADFVALKTIKLTRNLGRVLAGLNPFFNNAVTFTVDTGTDILTLASAASFTVGTPVQVTNTGGGLPAPLAANTVYFVSANSITDTTMKLSTTIENAYAGTDINITTAGTGTQTVQNALGAYVGESKHTMTITEIAAHDHGAESPAINLVGTGGTSNQYSTAGANAGTLSAATAPTGDGTPFNVMQPTTYMNVFIKL